MKNEEFLKAFESGKVVDYYLDQGEYVVVADVVIFEAFRVVSSPIGDITRKIKDKTFGRVHFDNYSDFVKKINN